MILVAKHISSKEVATREGGVDRNAQQPMGQNFTQQVATREGGVDRNRLSSIV